MQEWRYELIDEAWADLNHEYQWMVKTKPNDDMFARLRYHLRGSQALQLKLV